MKWLKPKALNRNPSVAINPRNIEAQGGDPKMWTLVSAQAPESPEGLTQGPASLQKKTENFSCFLGIL